MGEMLPLMTECLAQLYLSDVIEEDHSGEPVPIWYTVVTATATARADKS